MSVVNTFNHSQAQTELPAPLDTQEEYQSLKNRVPNEVLLLKKTQSYIKHYCTAPEKNVFFPTSNLNTIFLYILEKNIQFVLGIGSGYGNEFVDLVSYFIQQGASLISYFRKIESTLPFHYWLLQYKEKQILFFPTDAKSFNEQVNIFSLSADQIPQFMQEKFPQIIESLKLPQDKKSNHKTMTLSCWPDDPTEPVWYQESVLKATEVGIKHFSVISYFPINHSKECEFLATVSERTSAKDVLSLVPLVDTILGTFVQIDSSKTCKDLLHEFTKFKGRKETSSGSICFKGKVQALQSSDYACLDLAIKSIKEASENFLLRTIPLRHIRQYTITARVCDS